MADRCVAVMPEHPNARAMQADALCWLGEPEAAGGAFIQAARPDEDPVMRAKNLERARKAFAIARARRSD